MKTIKIKTHETLEYKLVDLKASELEVQLESVFNDALVR